MMQKCKELKYYHIDERDKIHILYYLKRKYV